MLWWLTLTIVLFASDVKARESRKEANLPVPVAVNEATTKDSGHFGHQSQEQHGVEDGDVVMNYDYFMHSPHQEGNHDPFFGLDQVYQMPETDSSRSPYSGAQSSGDGIVIPDYNNRDDDLYRDKANSPSHVSSLHRQETENPLHDPFSVFYDSLFPEMDSVIPIADTEINAENKPFGPHPTTRTPAGTTAGQHANQHRSPTTSPRRISPAADDTPTLPVVTTARPFNLTDSSHLIAMIPAYLEKLGISESLADQLFQNKSMLGRTLIQMSEDETFREVMGIISELDLPSLDQASLPKLLIKTSSTLATSILQRANLTGVTDAVNSLGLDTYLTGVFSRSGSAAQFDNLTGDGSKSALLTSTSSLATVQVVGFVLLVVVVLAAVASAFFGSDIHSVRKHRYAASRKQLVTTEAPMSWAEDDQKWLQVVDVAETSPNKWQEQWPGSRPSYYREELQVRHPEHRPPQPHRLPRPSRTRPEANFHFPKERPPPQSLLTLEPHNLHRHTHKEPTGAPEEHVDRRDYSSFEDDLLYHDQYTDEFDDYSKDYYYHEPSSQRSDANAVRRVPQHYLTTQNPTDGDHYTFLVSPFTTTTTSPPTRSASMRPHRNITRKRRPLLPTTSTR